MKHLVILFMGIMFISATCTKNSETCHTEVTILNNSDSDIYFGLSLRYPDTLILYPNPASAGDYYKVEKHSRKKDIDDECIENIFEENSSGTLMYYIYDAQTLETVPWDSVVKKYMILKRYELSLDDLQRMNWTITYP